MDGAICISVGFKYHIKFALYFRWKTAHSLIVDAKFTRQAMEDFVQASKIEFRLLQHSIVVMLSVSNKPQSALFSELSFTPLVCF